MSAALTLRASLVRGALVTLANWPAVVIEFAIEGLYKLSLAVPVVGGAFMVAVLAGGDVGSLFGDGVRSAAELVMSALLSAPFALGCFVVAVVLVAVGGAVLMFVVKAATLSSVVAGERRMGPLEGSRLRYADLRRAHAFSVPGLIQDIRRFGRRAAGLSLWLSAAYAVLFVGYLEALGFVFRLGSQSSWSALWPLGIAVTTSAAVGAMAVVNLAFDLIRVIFIHDDVSLRTAASRLRGFLAHGARQIVGILTVFGLVFIAAAAAALIVAAGLALVAWVPYVGFVVIPLQAAAWLVRGLLFQYLGLTTLAAYDTQYRPVCRAAGPAGDGFGDGRYFGVAGAFDSGVVAGAVVGAGAAFAGGAVGLAVSAPGVTGAAGLGTGRRA